MPFKNFENSAETIINEISYILRMGYFFKCLSELFHIKNPKKKNNEKTPMIAYFASLKISDYMLIIIFPQKLSNTAKNSCFRPHLNKI